MTTHGAASGRDVMMSTERRPTGDPYRRGRGFRYQPFYCEENVWWLCAEPEFASADALVLFIFNGFGRCPFAEQQAAAPGQVIWWDYHVVALDHRKRIWDLDSRLALPMPAADWLDGTFPFAAALPQDIEPRFRSIPCDEYRRDFASDRSHMRGNNGGWQRPTPPWPPIGTGMNLHRYHDRTAARPGELLDWTGLRNRLG